MSTNIHTFIKEHIKDAMRAKDSLRLDTLRGVSSMFTNELIAKGSNDPLVDDEAAVTLLKRAVKQRKDSIEQYEAGGRPELADKERAELAILTAYLPETMSKDQIKEIVCARIVEAGGTIDKTKLGQFIGGIMKELKGKADGADVKAVVESLVK